MKLFNLGLPGLRDNTLQKTLKQAGLTCAHWYVKPLKLHVGHAIYEDFLSGRDPVASLDGFDAVTQADALTDQGSYWPQMDISLLRMVREYHPECSFILPWRSADAILEEIDGHADFRERLTRWGAPGLPAGSARFDRMLLAWIENHHDAVLVTFGAEASFVSFNADQPHGWERLGRALGLALPAQDQAAAASAA